jgi:predicted O-methyltransferase YrrM
MNLAEELHMKFNQDGVYLSPVRIKRFKRDRFIRLLAELEFNHGVEVGVAEGNFSEYMLNTIPDLHLIGVDPWTRYSEDSCSMLVGKDDAEKRYREAKERYNRYSNAYICRETSMEAVRDFEEESLDFVYIDGNHEFDYVMQDLIEWSKRVRIGGIIAGHDYYRFRRAGVIDAVDIYTRMHRVQEWYITDERTPTYFWVKECTKINKKENRRLNGD